MCIQQLAWHMSTHVVAFAEVNRRQLDCLRSCVLFLALVLTQCPRALLSPVAADVPFRIEEGGHWEGGYALVSGFLEMYPADGAALQLLCVQI
jgi:hypothetical protein